MCHVSPRLETRSKKIPTAIFFVSLLAKKKEEEAVVSLWLDPESVFTVSNYSLLRTMSERVPWKNSNLALSEFLLS
jgi:hypothetical protein